MPPGPRSQSKFIATALIKNNSLLPVHTVRPCGGERVEACGRSDRDQASDDRVVSSNWVWLLCYTWFITNGFQFKNHPHKRLQSDTQQEKESHWNEETDKYSQPPITTPRLICHLSGMKGEEQEHRFRRALVKTDAETVFLSESRNHQKQKSDIETRVNNYTGAWLRRADLQDESVQTGSIPGRIPQD